MDLKISIKMEEGENKTFFKKLNIGVVGDYINTMKTTSNSILIYIKPLKGMYTQKHRSQERQSF